MNCPGWARVVMTVQLLYALSLIGLSLYVVMMGYRWGFRFETANDLILASAVLGAPGVFAFVGWWGLGKRRLWGWLIALSADVLLLFMFTCSVANDGLRNIDRVTAAFTILSWTIAVCLLFPPVRRYYVRGHEIRPIQTSS